MRALKVLFIGSLLSALSFFANAQSICTWQYAGGASYPGGWVNTSICLTPAPNVEIAASRTIYSDGRCTFSAYPGFAANGTCRNLIITRVTTSSSSSSSSSSQSSSVASTTIITRVINDSSSNCSTRSVAGGHNFVIWGVACPGYPEVFVEKSYSSQFNTCSVKSTTAGFTVTGSCTDYRIRG